MALGEGLPPKETFSTLILIIITLGVAIPTAMLVSGCVVLGVRHYRRHQPENILIIDQD